MKNLDHLVIEGARQNNLKNISLKIPKKKIIAITGISGSGKSSLIVDTIYAEAQRQLIEAFNSGGKKSVSRKSRPLVDKIENLSPVIIIDQKKIRNSPRSTVGTYSDIYSLLRFLFAYQGSPALGYPEIFSFNNPAGMCPHCQGLGESLGIDMDALIDWNKSIHEGAILHPSYKVNGWRWKELEVCGFFPPDIPLKDLSKKDLDVLLYSQPVRYKKMHGDRAIQTQFEGVIPKLNRLHAGKENPTENEKKINAAFFSNQPCPECKGSRLNQDALSVTFRDSTIADLASMEISRLSDFLSAPAPGKGGETIHNIRSMLKYLIDIGLGYLSLNRGVSTLSGGESQRLKIAGQLGCSLVDLLYIFDEPSIGLHPKDISILIKILKNLKEKGNSLFVVEHDPGLIEIADHIIDIGPGAGTTGGEIIFQGNLKELKKSGTVTGEYLTKHQTTPCHHNTRKPENYFQVKKASLHNLKNISLKVPLGLLVAVTGVAGSGKSTLVVDIIGKKAPGAVVIDQSPPGVSNRSNVATYIGVFDLIRKEIANETGISAGLFSFNSAGACKTCKGHGYIRTPVHYMEDIIVKCDKCGGKRYSDEVLAYKYRSKNIHQILKLTVKESILFFDNPAIVSKLEFLRSVGLDYLELGQPLNTLSGGEAQRTKLAGKLDKRGNIFIMDEPTTGLHMADVEKLLIILHRMVNQGNSVFVIEHNMDVVRNAHWIIDMGPEGGNEGGEVVVQGTPEEVAACSRSYTGQYLKKLLYNSN